MSRRPSLPPELEALNALVAPVKQAILRAACLATAPQRPRDLMAPAAHINGAGEQVASIAFNGLVNDGTLIVDADLNVTVAPVNEPQHLRRGNRPSLIVSNATNGKVALSTEIDEYIRLNERELVWLIEEAGPKALAFMRQEKAVRRKAGERS